MELDHDSAMSDSITNNVSRDGALLLEMEFQSPIGA